jgi:hypothetical protein
MGRRLFDEVRGPSGRGGGTEWGGILSSGSGSTHGHVWRMRYDGRLGFATAEWSNLSCLRNGGSGSDAASLVIRSWASA